MENCWYLGTMNRKDRRWIQRCQGGSVDNDVFMYLCIAAFGGADISMYWEV